MHSHPSLQRATGRSIHFFRSILITSFYPPRTLATLVGFPTSKPQIKNSLGTRGTTQTEIAAPFLTYSREGSKTCLLGARRQAVQTI